MPYRHYTSSSPVYFSNARDNQRFSFQSMLDELFYDSPSVYTIQEETAFASGSWVSVDVRINQALDRQTGNKLGNDFKMILFEDLDHSAGLGRKYSFDDNIWLTINLENYKGLVKTSVIRKCNATLRWTDENGNCYSEPCSIDYELNRARDEMGTKDPVTPQGYVDVYCQLNDHTKIIEGNQRFLFGPVENRVGFKVFGNGVRNFLNEETTDDSSCALLVLTMGADYTNQDDDDLVNGIADYNKNLYVLTTSPSAIYANIGDIKQIVPALTWNGNPSDKNILYTTSSSVVATVSASGLVNMVSNGTAIITGYMADNVGITDTTSVIISGSQIDAYEVRISPAIDLLYQGESQTYTTYLYENGIVQANSFVFTLADANVPVANYNFNIINGNSFTLENVKFYLSSPLSIICTSGSYTKQADIYLRGSW